jgi:hypothetical protein
MALFRPESLQKSDYNHLKPQTTDILFANMGTSKDPKKHLKKKTQKIHSFPQVFQHHPAPNRRATPRGAGFLPRTRQLLLQPGRAWEAAVISSEAMLPGSPVPSKIRIESKDKAHG